MRRVLNKIVDGRAVATPEKNRPYPESFSTHCGRSRQNRDFDQAERVPLGVRRRSRVHRSVYLLGEGRVFHERAHLHEGREILGAQAACGLGWVFISGQR
jgi:hypothetical protein